jgi:hypothetical protein
MIFSIDKWENNINKGDEVLVKSEQDVEKQLSLLNGKDITQLVANGKDCTLLIGGGDRNFVVTYIVGNHEDFFNLINEEDANDFDEIEVVTGGQAGLFPKSIVNDFQNALSSLLYFYKFQQMDPALTWEND